MESQQSKTLKSGQVVTGNVRSIAQLSAKFQIWARQYGTTDAESLACWIADDDDKNTLYFSGVAEADELAQLGFEKIKGIEIPDLSDV